MRIAAKKENGNFGEGRVIDHIVNMALPMIIALLINILYSVVDRVYIGHIPGVGELSLTGIGLVGPVVTLVVACQNLFGSGGSPVFSIARGKGDENEAANVQNNACFMLVLIGIVLTALVYIFKTPLLYLIGASESTFTYAERYLSIYAAGTVFVMFSLGMNPYINAQGDAKTGMLTVALGAVVNIILDPIFIFVFGMGLEGAAIATVIAQFCSAVWVLLYFCGSKAKIKLNFKGFKPDLKVIGRIASLGVTEFVFQFTNAAVLALYNNELQSLGGDIWVACLTIVYSVREITMVVVLGMVGAAKPIISYNYGAQLYDRTKEAIRLMFIICLGYMLVVWAAIMLAPKAFVLLFNNNPELTKNGAVALRLFFSLFFCGAMQMCGQTVFVSLGRAKPALFFSMLRKVILIVPLAIILPKIFGLGVYGVFLADPVSQLIGGSSCFIAMMLTVWKNLSVEKQ